LASVIVNGIASDPRTLVITSADAQCTNLVLGGAETDVDCGGGAGCARCASGRVCTLGPDCDSTLCQEEICQGAVVPVQFVRSSIRQCDDQRAGGGLSRDGMPLGFSAYAACLDERASAGYPLAFEADAYRVDAAPAATMRV
jgi:hypothetical protein